MNKRQKIVQERFLNNEEAVIRRLKQVYNQSLKDINTKAQELQIQIAGLQAALDAVEDAAEKDRLKSMIQSKVYQKQYQDALKKQISSILDNMQVEEFKTVSEYLQKCYEEGFIGTMYDLQGQGIPLCFPLDQEAMVRAVQLDSKISHGLYTRLGEDVSVLKKKITAQVSRGIATGMTFQQVAQQLAGYTNIGYNNAVRIARTEGHRIQVQGTMDACYKAKDKGADVVKRWNATLDSRTRDSHWSVHLQVRELDETFSNGLRFPGDPSGRPEEVINCRCALEQKSRWALDEDETQMLGDVSKMDDITKKRIAEMLKVPVDELDEYSKCIVPIKAKDYDDFKKQYKEIWNYKGSDLEKEVEARLASYYSTKKSSKVLEKSEKSSKMDAEEIVDNKSLGAKAKNYDIELPNKEIVHLTEGTRITNIETIAGKGRNRQIDEVNDLIARWGGSEFEWQKKKGFGYVDYDGESYRAELHWYEEPTAGRHKWKVKPDADGNWFIED